MKKIIDRLHKFFFPPTDANRWVRMAPYIFMGFLTLLVLVGSAYGWEYTNSPEFCGSSCHTMPPEYTAYLVSPHARIACVDCHIGRSFIATQITRKAGDIKHVVYTVFKNYEYPITANEMRPARETCEKCHSPEKFSDDSLVELKKYSNDKENSPTSTFLVLKTGGGAERQGQGRGIHWHIVNKVLYYPTDRSEQKIPYIRVYNADGSIVEYTDIESDFDPEKIAESELEEMDCITCHNRITHLVNQPEVSMDTLLANGVIDATIPEIRLKGVQALRGAYSSQEEAIVAINALVSFYQVSYPEYYANNQAKIELAVISIEDVYKQSVYLEQKSDWNSHPNNVGHLYSPGCFRCHDGKHLNPNQEAIRLECNLCHSVPVVADNQDFVADIEISRGPEPNSHHNPNWISLHREALNNTCANCHDTSNPGGIDNTSFCSNSACHGYTWEFAGFDAPGLREILVQQLPAQPAVPEIPEGPLTYDGQIGTLLQARCGNCHGENGIQGLDLTHYASLLEGSDQGPVIVPGDAVNSLIVQKLTGDQPHFARLSVSEMELLINWINAGAPEK